MADFPSELLPLAYDVKIIKGNQPRSTAFGHFLNQSSGEKRSTCLGDQITHFSVDSGEFAKTASPGLFVFLLYLGFSKRYSYGLPVLY